MRLLTTFLIIVLLVSCSEHIGTEVEEIIPETEENVEESEMSEKETTKDLDSLDYSFFEKIENTWEYPTENPILTEYGFVIKSLDTIIVKDSKTIKTVFMRANSDDQIEVMDSQQSDGEFVFIINYTSSDSKSYESLNKALSGSESLYIQKDKQFEKFGLGSYEDKIFRQARTIKNGEEQFTIKYRHRIGKELMSAPLSTK